MSTTPTNVNFSDTSPVAKPDAINVEWQAGAPYSDPNDPTKLVRDTSACYRVPQVGGVVVLTADYQLGGPDSGWTFVVNSSSAVTITMPASVPSLPSLANGVWNVKIRNLGAGQVTLDPNGLNLDGSSSTLKINQNCGREISTDGTGYYSSIIASGVVGTVDARTTTSETISAASQQKLVTISNASAVAVALDSTVGAAFMCWLLNLGAGAGTLTPSSGTINGSASISVTTGNGCVLFFDGTNWEAVTGGGGGGGGTPGGSNHQVQINSSGSFGGIATGTAGQYLRSGGASADPAFASIAESEVTNLTSDLAALSSAISAKATSPLTTKGDIWTRSASADARQAVGSDGQVLQADSSQPNGIKWVNAVVPLGVCFIINNGTAGNNVGPMLLAAHSGNVTKCEIITKASDPTVPLTLRIMQNGVNVFTSNPSVAAATASGTVSSSIALTSNPLPVAFNDKFKIDIISGSPQWAFTVQLET